MQRGASAVEVWTQVSVASRLVEVNTKTGFSLTAGSYVVRASSTQTGTVTLQSATSGTASISSVTTTRAKSDHQGLSENYAASDRLNQLFARSALSAATTVTVTKASGGAGEVACVTAVDVMELF